MRYRSEYDAADRTRKDTASREAGEAPPALSPRTGNGSGIGQARLAIPTFRLFGPRARQNTGATGHDHQHSGPGHDLRMVVTHQPACVSVGDHRISLTAAGDFTGDVGYCR